MSSYSIPQIWFKEVVLIKIYFIRKNVELKESIPDLEKQYNETNMYENIYNREKNIYNQKEIIEYIKYMSKQYEFILSICDRYKLKILYNTIKRRIQLLNYFANNYKYPQLLTNMYKKCIKGNENNVLCEQITLYAVVMFSYFSVDTNTFCDNITKRPFQFLSQLYRLSMMNKNDSRLSKFAAMYEMVVYKSYNYDYDNCKYYFYSLFSNCRTEHVSYYIFKIMFKYYINSHTNSMSGLDDDERRVLSSITSNIKDQYSFVNRHRHLSTRNEYLDFVDISYRMYRDKIPYQSVYIIHKDSNKTPVIINMENRSLNFEQLISSNNVQIGGDTFEIVTLNKHFKYDKKIQDVFLFKAMKKNIEYKSFINFRGPTWFGIYNTAKTYIGQPVVDKNEQQGIYAFSLYNSTKLFSTSLNNLITIKRLFGKKKVWMLGYTEEEWYKLVDTCIGRGIIINRVTSKRDLTYEKIVDYIFFNDQSKPRQITRRSIHIFDIVFAKGICVYLNEHINYYMKTLHNINENLDYLRVDGYYAPQLPYYKVQGQYFHSEIAFCDPYNILERRNDNKGDFLYTYSKNLKNVWCSISTDENVKCVPTEKYHKYEDTYLKYWRIIEKWAIYTTTAHIEPEKVLGQIEKWKSFSINIKVYNSIQNCVRCETIDKLTQFSYIFLNRLFSHISQNPYKLIPTPLISYNTGKISWRPNHGSVHHMRTIQLSTHIYNIFKERNPLMFIDYFPTNRHKIAAILSSVFVSLARIDEDNRDGTQGLKLPFDNNLWDKIFPTLGKNKEVIESIQKLKMTYSLTQLSSCFMFMSIIKTLLLPDDEEFVEILGVSNIFYKPDNNEELLKVLNTDYNSNSHKNIMYKIGVLHGLTMAPHYLEHCRGPYSVGIFRNFVYESLYKIGATYYDMALIMSNVINNILITGERNTWNGKTNINITEVAKACLYTDRELKQVITPDVDLDKFKICCKLFNKDQRYSEKFTTLSNNFKDTWKVLNIEENIKKVLHPPQPKIFFYDDDKSNFSNFFQCKNMVVQHIKRSSDRYRHTIEWLKFLDNVSHNTRVYGICLFISNGFIITYDHSSGISTDKIDDILRLKSVGLITGIISDMDYTLTKDVVERINKEKLINDNFKRQEEWNQYRDKILALCRTHKLKNLEKDINVIKNLSVVRNQIQKGDNISIDILCEYYFGGFNRIQKLRVMFETNIPFDVITANKILKGKNRLPILEDMLKYIGYDNIRLHYSKTGEKIQYIKSNKLCRI